MRKLKTMVLAVFILLTLSGCGQRGPLYLPEEPPKEIKPEKQGLFITEASIKKGQF